MIHFNTNSYCNTVLVEPNVNQPKRVSMGKTTATGEGVTINTSRRHLEKYPYSVIGGRQPCDLLITFSCCPSILGGLVENLVHPMCNRSHLLCTTTSLPSSRITMHNHRILRINCGIAIGIVFEPGTRKSWLRSRRCRLNIRDNQTRIKNITSLVTIRETAFGRSYSFSDGKGQMGDQGRGV